MPTTRRRFLGFAAAGFAGALVAVPSAARAPAAFKAVAFDGLAIFDARPVLGLAETLFPGQGAALSGAWRTRLFEYQWLRALGAHYADFREATESSLVFSANSMHLELTPQKKTTLMEAWDRLEPWSDVAPALAALRQAGVRLAIVSNMTQRMLDDGVQRAGLDSSFEHVISTDRIRSYKPDPRGYKLGTDALRLKPGDVLFAAFAGWDVAGARWFGHPTFWVNRLGSPMEELGATPDAMGEGLPALVEFALAGA